MINNQEPTTKIGIEGDVSLKHGSDRRCKRKSREEGSRPKGLSCQDESDSTQVNSQGENADNSLTNRQMVPRPDGENQRISALVANPQADYKARAANDDN